MQHLGIIEEKNFVPASEAAQRFGYTKDYLLLLAKQGKIQGQKIGHKWFVHPQSVEEFFAKSEQEKVVRRKQLSEARRAELKHATPVRIEEVPHKRRVALTEVFAATLIGLTMGIAGYLGTVGVGEVNHEAALRSGAEEIGFFEKLARSLYNLFGTEEVEVVVVGDFEGVTETLTSDVISATVTTSTSSEDSLVVAPVETFTDAEVEKVRSAFSDEVRVEVDPENPDTGIVIPRFREREGEAYRFLMVPVTGVPKETSS